MSRSRFSAPPRPSAPPALGALAVPCRAALAALLALAAACQTCPPEARARVLAPDFDTPEDGGRSFLAAFGCDAPEAEYRCLAESLKERYGATFDLYLLGRPQLREDLGAAVLFAAHMQPAGRELRDDGVLVWWAYADEVRFGLLMQQQWYYDVALSDGTRRGGKLPNPPRQYSTLGIRELWRSWGGWTPPAGAFFDFKRRDLIFQLRNVAGLRGLTDLQEIAGFGTYREWKIADVLPPPEERDAGASVTGSSP